MLGETNLRFVSCLLLQLAQESLFLSKNLMPQTWLLCNGWASNSPSLLSNTNNGNLKSLCLALGKQRRHPGISLKSYMGRFFVVSTLCFLKTKRWEGFLTTVSQEHRAWVDINSHTQGQAPGGQNTPRDASLVQKQKGTPELAKGVSIYPIWDTGRIL